MSKSKAGRNGVRIGKREFNRAAFEATAQGNAHTVEEILEMHKKGILRKEDYLFTIDGMKAIAHDTYKGAWNNCRAQHNPNTDWSRQVRNTDARTLIMEAFTT